MPDVDAIVCAAGHNRVVDFWEIVNAMVKSSWLFLPTFGRLSTKFPNPGAAKFRQISANLSAWPIVVRLRM